MLALLAPPTNAQENTNAAQEGDVFRPYVAARSIYDNNLFRLSDDEDAEAVIGTSRRSDRADILEAGLNVDLPISRQRLLLGISAERSWYQRSDFLDNTSKRAYGTLQWEIGNRWSGDVGFSYREALASFTQLQARVRDEIAQRRSFFNASYEFHPRWQVHAGLETFDLTREVRFDQNRDELTKKAGVRYTSRANNYIDLEARHTDASLFNGDPDDFGGIVGDGDPVDGTIDDLNRSYTQSDLNLEVDWRRSASHINAKLSYVDREHEDLPRRDYTGVNGRVTYGWNLTGKTLINFAVWRQIRSVDDAQASYALTRGVSVNPVWSATSKITVQGRLAYENFDYQGDPNFVAGAAPRREDTVRTASVSVGYKPYDNTELSLGYETEERDSTRRLVDYDYDAFTASVRVDF